MRGGVLRVLLASLTLAGLVFAASATAAPQRPRVLAVEFDNDVNPVTQEYVNDQIDRANDDGYSAVVIVLDTPGGLGSSMEKIVKKELASKVPVIVYIAPSGGGAGSAGVFIAEAADVLAMAPGTSIGSSTPISGGGGNLPSDERRKAINFYAAKLRSLAREHGRNGVWADAAVRHAVSATEQEALRKHVIDLTAPSVPALLTKIDGTKTKPKGIVLHTRGADVTRVHMSLWKRILDTLIDPNIIALMLSIGLIGILVELWHPGLIFPGTIGGVSLIVSLYGLQVLPVSWAGLLMMILAAGFFGAEPFVISHGALTLAGAVCFVIGALMLFDPAGPSYQVSTTVAVAIAGTLALFIGFALTKVVSIRRRPAAVGPEDIIGTEAVARRDGFVFAHGELWRARTEDGEPLRPGEHVQVEGMDGLTLRVRREREPAATK